MRRKSGFTLIEMIVTVAIGTIVLAAVYNMVLTGLKSSSSLEMRVTATQDVRAALDLMAMEIRMASFNPNFATGMWLGNQSYKGIQAASQYSILIEMDINGGSSGTAPDSVISGRNEWIWYWLTQDYIIRFACGDIQLQAFLGSDTAGGLEKTVRVLNSTLNIPIFTYYDGDGSMIPYANLPARIPDIRRIEIVLAVDTDDLDPNSLQRKRIIYSTSVIPRNHALP